MKLKCAFATLALAAGIVPFGRADALPAGYTELEWIDANGAQAIGAGYNPNYTDRIVVKFRLQDQYYSGMEKYRPAGSQWDAYRRYYQVPTNRALFCACKNSTATMTLRILADNKLEMRYNGTTKTSTVALTPGDHVIEFDGATRVGKLDGVTFASGWGAETGSLAAGLYLFYSHTNGSSWSDYMAGRLYRCTVYDKDNNVKVDLVPARNENATDIRMRYGVYDTVTGDFHSNIFSTGGGFGAGEKRSSVKYWTGNAGDGKWSSSGNWTNATGTACVPANGDSLEISVTSDTAMQNDIASLQLGPVYFRNRGASVTLSGQSLILNGEPRWAAEGLVTLNLPLVFGGTARNGVVLSNMATNFVTGAVSGTGGLSLSGYGSILKFTKPVTFAGGTEINAGYVWVTNLTTFGSSTIYLNNDVAKHGAELLHPHAAGMWLDTDAFSTPFHLGPASGSSVGAATTSSLGQGYNVQLMHKNMVCSSPVTGDASGLFSPRCAAYWSSADHSNAIRAQPVYYDGDIDLANGNVFSFQFQGTGSSVGGFMQVRGALRAKNLTFSNGGNGVSYLMNSGNSIGTIYVKNMQLMANGVANSFGGAVVYVDMNSQYNSSQIALGSADQNIDRIVCSNYISDSLASGTSIRICSGGQIRSPTTGSTQEIAPAGFPRLVMRATGDSNVDYYFYNKVALVWWPTDSSYTMTCIKRASTTTGEIVVSNGTFRIEQDATFAKSRFVEIGPGAAFCDATESDYSLMSITNLSIGAGGRLYTENAVMPITGSAVHLQFYGDGDDMGRLELADELELYPLSVRTNGVKVGSGVYTGSDGVAGAIKVPWLKGTCRLTVSSGATSGKWIGLASSYDIHEPANWDVNKEVDLTTGQFQGTFAISGSRADVGDAIAVNGFTFDLPGSAFLFRKSASSGLVKYGTGGVTLNAATAARTVTSEIPAKIGGTQTWTIGAKGTFVQKGGLKGVSGATYMCYLKGAMGGVLEIDATDEPGDFPGCFYALDNSSIAAANQTTLILKGDDPLGKSTTDVPFYNYDVPWLPSGTRSPGAEKTGVFYPGTAYDDDHRHVQLAGTRITKQVQCYATCKRKSVCSMAGTTNEFAGVVKMEHSQAFYVENGSKLIFSGGLLGRYTHQGGGTFYFRHDGTGTTEVREKPLYSPIGQMCPIATKATWRQSHFRFACTTNQMPCILPNGSDAMGVIDCDAPDVFAGKTQITLNAMGILDLHGNDQHIAALHAMTSGSTIRTDDPATLYVNNVYNVDLNNWTYVTTADGIMKGAFEGPLSVVKTGYVPLTIAGTNTATGVLTVLGGTVTFAAGGRWATLGGVSVEGDGARLEVTGKNQLGRLPSLSIDHGGKLYIEEGVEVRVDSAGAVFNGKTAAGGTWGSLTSSADHKDDTLFAGDGVVVVPYAGFYFFTE